MTDRVNYQPQDRRPLASRGLGWVKATASWLVRRRISPNAISLSSMGFALVGATCIFLTTTVDGTPGRVLWLAGALCVQLRLLANLFDGMVAIESGVASPMGELFNELPDRVSDALFLVALGFVQGSSVHFGYGAAVLAVFVAYVRAMGGVAGAGQVFAGVMAKPQRMFIVTVLCLFQAFAPAPWSAPFLPLGLGAVGVVLAAICLGCVVTSFARISTIGAKLRGEA